MFDVGASELLLIVVVAVVVIGPKDLPLAMRTAGRWIAKVRRVSNHFRAGIETMIREAEMEEMERKWKEQNKAIMEQHPEGGDATLAEAVSAEARGELPPATPPHTPASSVPAAPGVSAGSEEPQLPLGGPPPPP